MSQTVDRSSQQTQASTPPLIPITKPYLGEEEAQAAAEAIRTGWIAQGPLVARFEEAIAARLGVAHVVATSNCTTSLHVALLCSGVGPGDEVICPSFSFIATANAVLYTGARPVFVDIDPRTYNIDPAAIEAAITPRTKAIIPVDQIGLAADLDAVLEIAERYHLRVIEDAAPALGATYRGRPVGAISPVTCFSFHPRKSITTGEGGAIATNDADLAARARVLRSHGASVSDLARHSATSVIIEAYEELGYNYRMTDIQAAIGLEQLKKLDAILVRRRELAERYNTRLLRDSWRHAAVCAGRRATYLSVVLRASRSRSDSIARGHHGAHARRWCVDAAGRDGDSRGAVLRGAL